MHDRQTTGRSSPVEMAEGYTVIGNTKCKDVQGPRRPKSEKGSAIYQGAPPWCFQNFSGYVVFIFYIFPKNGSRSSYTMSLMSFSILWSSILNILWYENFKDLCLMT